MNTIYQVNEKYGGLARWKFQTAYSPIERFETEPNQFINPLIEVEE